MSAAFHEPAFTSVRDNNFIFSLPPRFWGSGTFDPVAPGSCARAATASPASARVTIDRRIPPVYSRALQPTSLTIPSGRFGQPFIQWNGWFIAELASRPRVVAAPVGLHHVQDALRCQERLRMIHARDQTITPGRGDDQRARQDDHPRAAADSHADAADDLLPRIRSSAHVVHTSGMFRIGGGYEAGGEIAHVD